MSVRPSVRLFTFSIKLRSPLNLRCAVVVTVVGDIGFYLLADRRQARRELRKWIFTQLITIRKK